MSQPTTTTDPQPDADGYLPATARLACPYAGCPGELTPILEYVSGSYSEHRDWTGTECDGCMAEWEKDGTPRRGPHAATLAYRARVAEETARIEADPQAFTKLAQEKA